MCLCWTDYIRVREVSRRNPVCSCDGHVAPVTPLTDVHARRPCRSATFDGCKPSPYAVGEIAVPTGRNEARQHRLPRFSPVLRHSVHSSTDRRPRHHRAGRDIRGHRMCLRRLHHHLDDRRGYRNRRVAGTGWTGLGLSLIAHLSDDVQFWVPVDGGTQVRITFCARPTETVASLMSAGCLPGV